jgi:CRP-like cAMP-binding protein
MEPGFWRLQTLRESHSGTRARISNTHAAPGLCLARFSLARNRAHYADAHVRLEKHNAAWDAPAVKALRERLGDAAQSFGRVFRNPNIRRIEGAWAASIIAHWAYGIALAVFAYREGGAAAVGLIGLVRFLPSAIASPFAAVLGDRFRRERVIVVAELTRALLLAATTAVVVVDGPAAAVYVLAGLVAIAYSAVRPAQAALLPSLAKTPQELTAANVTSSTIESLGIFGGPAIGGILLAATSPEVVFGACAAAFLVSALLVSRVRVEEQPEPREVPESVFREFTAGFVTLAREPGLRLLVFLLVSQTLVAGALNVLIVVTALQLLELGEEGVGFLNSAVGIGGLLGAVLSAALIGRRLTTNFVLGIFLWGIPISLMGVFPDPLPTLVFLALVGLGNTLVDVSAFTLLQRAVPDEVLARVFGAVQGLWVATIGIGAILAPVLIAAVGIRGALLATGALLPILAVLLRRRLSTLDEAPVPERELALLRDIDLFAPLPQATLEGVAQALSPVRLATGEEVFRQGEVGDRYYIVAEGEVEIVVDGQVVNVTGPGGYFGEIALLRDVPRTATVRAKNDVELLALDREDFIAAVTGHAASLEAADSVIATRLGSLRPGLASV